MQWCFSPNPCITPQTIRFHARFGTRVGIRTVIEKQSHGFRVFAASDEMQHGLTIVLAGTIDVSPRFQHASHALKLASDTDNDRRDILVALEIRIGTVFQQISRDFRIESQQRADSMLVNTIRVCALLDPSHDVFEITFQRSLNKCIISCHFKLSGTKDGHWQDQSSPHRTST
jgi:hypothetical protein